MDPLTIISKLKELGHANSRRLELQEYCDQKIDQITKFLPRYVLNSDGPDILDCLLNGLPDTPPASCRNKIKLIDIVLESMRKESTSLTHCCDVISRIRLEVPRMPISDLVRWCNDSIQSILDDNDINMIWCDILPICMTAISTYDTVKHNNTDISSEEYRDQCLNTLCQCRWTERQLVQLAGMFKDMQLPKNSHKQVVNKMCSYIIDLPPDIVPPLVHQIVRLCKTHNLEIVLAHLSHYFSVRLYSKLEPPPQDSESTTMDIDDITPHSPAELSRALSTCIYHISQGAVDPELVKKHIKTWPKTQLLRAPFVIDLALAISVKGRDFRQACLDAIRSAIELRVTDELKCKESAWVRSVIPPDVDVACVLKLLTTESVNHRELTVMGLINLAFLLLSVPRTRQSAHACWSHGKLILVRLSKAQPETVGYILTELSDRIAMDVTNKQYADCLHVLCKLTPVSVERCSQLSTLLENCQPSPGEYVSAGAVLDAVHPLLNFSIRTRDTLVMLCRKGLFSRDSVHRCVSVCGLLSVLRHVKVSRYTGTGSSQSSSDQFSGHSYLTQITVNLHATQAGAPVTSVVKNEAVCMEVVSILRRCLVQDSDVKKLLYAKLFECVREKPVLHECILELFYEHLLKYIPEEDSQDTSLLWDKIITINGVEAVLAEPISHLLYLVAQFLQPAEEDVDDILSSQSVETSSAYLKGELNKIMLKLSGRDSIGHIDVEVTGLNDLTPESKVLRLKTQQMLQCYEALIAYRIMQCSVHSENLGATVYSLFKACNQLLEQTKVTTKSKKNKLNETKDTAKSQKSQKSQKDKEKSKGPIKLSNLTKERVGPFKPLPCIWDLKFCIKIMELLYSEHITWCPQEQRNTIRSRRDFHHWVLRGVTSVCQLTDRRDAPRLLTITGILYDRCVCRLQAMIEFDEQTALSCLELFKICINLLYSNNFSLKLENVVPSITKSSEGTPSEQISVMLEHAHTALLQFESEDEEQTDAMSKKLLAALLGVTAALLEIPTDSCTKMGAVIVKLEEYIRTSKQDCLSLLPALLTAICREQQEAQLIDDLLLKVNTALGRIDEEDTSAGEESQTFPSIDSRTGHVVLNHICLHLSARLKSTEHLMARARDLTAAANVAIGAHVNRIDRELKELYKCIVIQLCQLCSWCSRCGKCRCCVGPGSERVLALCVRLYAVLAQLAKQIDAGTAMVVRYERLLKLSGKKLSSITDNLITYIEASQTQQDASKVLRDTKLIPRLVLEAEQYSKNVILLANKAKVNWQQYLSLGTARDFRIKAPVLEEILNARERQDENRAGDQDDINDATTGILTPVREESEPGSDEETVLSVGKRRRFS